MHVRFADCCWCVLLHNAWLQVKLTSAVSALGLIAVHRVHCSTVCWQSMLIMLWCTPPSQVLWLLPTRCYAASTRCADADTAAAAAKCKMRRMWTSRCAAAVVHVSCCCCTCVLLHTRRPSAIVSDAGVTRLLSRRPPCFVGGVSLASFSLQ